MPLLHFLRWPQQRPPAAVPAAPTRPLSRPAPAPICPLGAPERPHLSPPSPTTTAAPSTRVDAAAGLKHPYGWPETSLSPPGHQHGTENAHSRAVPAPLAGLQKATKKIGTYGRQPPRIRPCRCCCPVPRLQRAELTTGSNCGQLFVVIWSSSRASRPAGIVAAPALRPCQQQPEQSTKSELGSKKTATRIWATPEHKLPRRVGSA